MPSGEVQVWKCWQSWGREGLIHQGPRPVHGSWSRRLCLCFLLGERVAGNEWESTAELERFWSVCPMCQRVSVLAWNAKCGGFQWRGGLLLFKLRLSFDGILVQFSCSVMSNFLRPRELQHTRPPCPSLTPGVHPNSCPLSRWCHPTISSSVIPFSSCPQSFPASGSFQMSQLFASGGQRTGVSASKSVLPRNTQDWSPKDGLVGSPCSPRDSQESSPTPHFRASILRRSAFFIVQL